MADTAKVRIVFSATQQEKKNIVTKADKLNLPVAELMRRSVLAYDAESAQEELGALADQAKAAAERAADSIDEMLAFVEASNQHIEEMEMKAAGRTSESA